MKKILFILFLIVVMVIGTCLLIIYNQGEKRDDRFYIEIYDECNDVDDGINKLMNSKEYKKMNEEEKGIVVEKFLELYENSKKIKNLYYDSDNKLYSFTYSTGELDGALGGVSLKEFAPMFNE